MGLSRNVLLWASENKWMRKNVPGKSFVKKAVKKFMPGETIEDALSASRNFDLQRIPTTFTHLGENITNLDEGLAIRDHYLQLIDKIDASKLDIEISLKLTQLGLSISSDETYTRFQTIVQKAKEKLNNVVWIDMESSGYTQQTIEFYKKIKQENDNVGLCLQAYLNRTEKDFDNLLKLSPNIRLVKGAYKEPADVAFAAKTDVNKNYFALSKKLLNSVKEKNIRAAFATHDENLIYSIIKESKYLGVQKNNLEFQMLYGIKPAFQKSLVMRGYKLRVLISYGDFWYPWYMRRLAERPANVWFVLKNILN